MLDPHPEEIALTPKGEAYAAAFSKMKPSDLRRLAEGRIQRHLDAAHALMAVLDEIDGDADSEPTLGAPNSSPGWVDHGSQTMWAAGSNADGEAEDVCEDEGAEHDGREPALGWTDMESRYGRYGLGIDDEQEEDDPAGGDILDEPHDEASTADLEPDEPSWPFCPNGAHLPGGGSDAA